MTSTNGVLYVLSPSETYTEMLVWCLQLGAVNKLRWTQVYVMRVSQIRQHTVFPYSYQKGRLTSALTLSVYLYTLRETDTFFLSGQKNSRARLRQPAKPFLCRFKTVRVRPGF
jgi:hypothetical protein